MRRRRDILVILCVIIISSMSAAISSADYGLEWGFEVGDQFHFRKSGTPFVPVVEFYVEIDSIPFDSTNFNNLTYENLISYVNFYTCYNDDGSEKTQPETISVLPIGNWSYFVEFWNVTGSVLNITEWIDTETEWGFVATLDSSFGNITTTMKFSKIDGVMTFKSTVTELEDGITTTTQTERRYPGNQQLLSTEIIVGIGVVIIALVIVGVVVKFRQN